MLFGLTVIIQLYYREEAFQDFWDQTEIGLGVYLSQSQATNHKNCLASSITWRPNKWRNKKEYSPNNAEI